MMFKKLLILGLGSILILAFASCSSLDASLTKVKAFVKSKSTSSAQVKAKTKATTKAKTIATTKAKTPSKTAFIPQSASQATISKAASLPKDKHGMPTYTKPSARTRYVRTTAYSHMENEPGAPGRLTASGNILKYGSVRSAAADWSVYPLGTLFRIKGLPHTYVVDDYGSALVGTNTIDIFKPSLRLMNRWGTRKTEITVVKWGSYERSLYLLKGRRGYSHCRRMYYACQDCIKRGLTAN